MEKMPARLSLMAGFIAAIGSCSNPSAPAYQADGMINNGLKFGNVYIRLQAVDELAMTDTLDGSQLSLSIEECGGLIVEGEYLVGGQKKSAHANEVSEGVFTSKDLMSYSFVTSIKPRGQGTVTHATYLDVQAADQACARKWFARAVSRITFLAR